MKVSCFLIALLLLSPSPARSDEFELRVNAGGSQLTLPDGTYFASDGPYSPQQGYGWHQGWDHDTWHAIGGCPDDRLYRYMHHAPDIYQVDCPNGSYAVTLHLCDVWSHGVGERNAAWRINDVLLLNQVDLYSLVERDYAIDFCFPVEVTAGAVLIEDRNFDGAMLYGVSVVAHEPDSQAPAAPLLTEILSGYEQVILNWEDNDETDLAGYEITRQGGAGLREMLLGEEPNRVSRYIDQDVLPGETYRYWLSSVDIYGNHSYLAGPYEATPLPIEAAPLPACYIDIDPDSLAALNALPQEDVYYSCQVTLDGMTYDAGLRYRGNVVRKLLKKSYKINLGPGLLYEGRDKLNCNSEMCDPSLMRESLSMDLMRDAGLPTPRTWWRAVVLNGQMMGAYCDVEQPDDHFLTAHGLDQDANIYKCFDRLVVLPDSLDYLENYEKETNEDGSWSDLIEFIETLNLTPDDELYETLVDCVEFDQFLSYYATLMLINDGDATYKNYYLYHDLDDDWWQVIPWDKDLTWGVRWPFLEGISWNNSLLQGAAGGGNILTWRITNEPALRNAYASRLYEWITERYPLQEIYARIDAAQAVTGEIGEVDFRKWYWEENQRLREASAELREFADGRYAHIRESIAALLTPQELYINEFMAANASTYADEFGEFDDWIEIYNPSEDPVAMSDYFLTDSQRNTILWNFPDTTIAPGSLLLVWADEDTWQGPLHANFKLDRNGEMIALHKKEAGAGPEIGPDDIDPIDLVYFGPQIDDIARARRGDGDFRWCFPDSATPGTSNGDGSGVDNPWWPAKPPSLRILAAPNPSPGWVHLSLPGTHLAGAYEIFDAGGRLCRRISAVAGVTGFWDGRAASGRAVSPGTYWARFRSATGAESGTTRLIVVR